MTYSISDIQQILSADWRNKANPAATVDHLLIDSRKLTLPGVSLFFALPGKRHDGHRFLADLYRMGVRNFVVSEEVDLQTLSEANVLKVPNSLFALQDLAAYHRSRFNIPVIGITGSNGKTVIKEWLWQLLSPDFNIVKSPKSYNSQVGVPLSVWQLNEHHQLAIFEAGISTTGEMERLEKIIKPGIGIFTNLGTAHQEGFNSEEQKFLEKCRLFENAKLVFGPPENSNHQLAEYLNKIPAVKAKWHAAKSWSLPTEPPPGGLADTTMICYSIMEHLGIAQDKIEQRLHRLEPVEMRLELKGGIQDCTLVNDFYNNDLAGLRIALDFASQQVRKGKFTLILSDILQSGLPPKSLWSQVAEAILAQGVNRLISIGSEISTIKNHLPDGFDTRFFPDTNTFLKQLDNADFFQETILLKGARPFEFEKIARRLERQSHKTVLEVNLTALVHNLHVYNKMLKAGTKMMVMVKAAGYGSGSADVAKLLEFHRVDYLGVAYADEGVELRQAGVQTPILVLNPEQASFDALYRYNLEPEIYSLSLLRELCEYAGNEKQLAIHLKLDTGMHRLGFEAASLPELLGILKANTNLRVRSIFSHLSASDNEQHDAFSHQQAQVFMHLYTQIIEVLGYEPMRHICNTGGIERFPEYHFDMVRLGIGLYGVGGAEVQPRLRTVNVLKATISQIKEVPAGDSVGYNRNSGILKSSKRTATISLGYADGFLRLAGNGRYSVMLHGQKAPTVGNICMDMSMIDVSHIPNAREGDEVIIFGANPTAQELASSLQTIPYEVFTNVADRVKRVYWEE